MGFNPNGGHRAVSAEERLNVFALVVYIPDPLGRFLDDVRRELAPNYNPHAHVSVLPPRPLAVDWREASEQARAITEAWPPFDVHLGSVKRFPVTEVIYLELTAGGRELRRLHDALNSGHLSFEEPFDYHPHVTVAQEIPPEDVAGVFECSVRRWNEYRGPRSFRVDRAMFVQNTLDNRWIDLAEYSFAAVALR